MFKFHQLVTTSLVVSWLTLGGIKPSQGANFAYESFNYSPTSAEDSLLNGPINGVGLNGGIGWLPYKNEAPSATHFGTSGLSYTDNLGNRLLTSGRSGALTNNVGEHGSFRFINTSAVGFPIPTLPARDPNLGDPGSQTQPGLGVDNTTVWLSFLMRVPVTSREDWDGKYAGISLFYDDFINGQGTGPFPLSKTNERLFMGAPYGQSDRPLNFGIDHPGAPNPIFTNQTFSGNQGFFLARFDFGEGASDRVRIWLNPDLNTNPSSSSADIDYVMPFDFQFNRIGIFGNSPFGGSNLIEFDEIRLGSSFDDVTPVIPEPSFNLVGLFSLVSFMGLKRCSKRT